MASVRVLCTKARRYRATSIRHMHSGNFRRALKNSLRVLDLVTQLRGMEPDDFRHVLVEAGQRYNHAAILDHLGRTEEAVVSARMALNLYRQLGACDDAEQVESTAGTAVVGAARGLSAAEISLMAADVKARLARLLAKSRGTAAADEVHRLGQSAVALYERLVRQDPRRIVGLERVRIQYATACAHLERR